MSPAAAPILEVRDLVQTFQSPDGRRVHAVSGISFDVYAGETLGLVGESGCGKSTTARAVLQAPPPTAGQVRFMGTELTATSRSQLRQIRRQMQLVFQDPHASLDPRWTVEQSLTEPLRVRAIGDARSRPGRVRELIEMVGLDARHASRKPGELSGGQCQRVAIARALASDPSLVIFDEAVSSLDVSVQAQVLNLIGELRHKLSLTSVFIAHDLAVVRYVSDRVGVMYLGRLCELGPSDRLFSSPAHPYTAALLDAVPHVHTKPDPSARLRRLAGDLPSPLAPPSGCRFRTRCDRADEQCAAVVPSLVSVGEGHSVACHHPLTAFTSVRVRSAVRA